MIICIGGYAGSGKDSVGATLAKHLGVRHIRFSFKEEAQRRGMSLMEFQKLANNDKEIDQQLDKKIVEEAQKQDCVVTTWLCAWMIPNATLRVWLEASVEERAKRVARRDGMTIEDARQHVIKRDADNKRRYKRYYGIDIEDHSIFDLIIRSDRFLPDQIAEIVKVALHGRL